MLKTTPGDHDGKPGRVERSLRLVPARRQQIDDRRDPDRRKGDEEQGMQERAAAAAPREISSAGEKGHGRIPFFGRANSAANHLGEYPTSPRARGLSASCLSASCRRHRDGGPA
jgi:hypothetical protein